MEEKKDGKIIAEGTITELKKIADGKVTIIVTKEEIPDISFFTNTRDGKPQFEFLQVGKKYKFEYYMQEKDGKTYFNLLNATEVDGFVSSNSYTRQEASNGDKIIRQSVLKVAVEIVATKYKNNLTENIDLTDETIQIAELLEKWVQR